ncbi:2-phosphoglycolate phosphatase [Plasmopara halstedii]|uniref:2-phosphoglycolate phosphatase n=1 Tax=Plasmopara halstedii TaxID=4781 RepID=A0A0P1B645_PLAHL|nr:2-phosphoglycolate phosphatase [Plasmopara halstedii]CEG49512.1 2-phosphoglycolate phosphatase [Plasmopara halstedii]|eukprot:XP_024585881.1 2-phosphoglycolate phosphatase [Plasmopara halstedii]
MTAETQRLNRESYLQWIQGLDAFLFDCDGVLWRGATPIQGAAVVIDLLRSLNKRVVFVTNNATSSRATYVKKLASQGITAVESDIVTSAWATAQYMKLQNIEGKIYIIGEAGLKSELELEGYQVSGMEHSDIKGFPHVPVIDLETKAVVCGLDRYLSYFKMAYATACVRQIPGCRFIGTNPDSTYPADGAIVPGGGSLVRMLECAIGHPPEAVCGKPSQDLLQTIIATYNLDPARTCMVGDRLSTDIEFGNAGGLSTLLVLTGITHESELGSIVNPLHVPDYYIDSIDAINQLHAGTLDI